MEAAAKGECLGVEEGENEETFIVAIGCVYELNLGGDDSICAICQGWGDSDNHP